MKALTLSILIGGMSLSLMGCQKGENFLLDQGFLSQASEERAKEIENKELKLYGTFDADCLIKGYDACVFHKSPVSQIGAPLSDGLLSFTSDISGLQSYAVELRGLDGSGFLQNTTFAVHPAAGDRPQSTDWRVDFAGDTDQVLSQIMTYYWANLTKEILELRTGEFHANGKGLSIYTADTVAGWSSQFNEIHLSTTDTGNQMGLDASMIVHFVGMANVYHANGGAIADLAGDTKHATCGEGGGVIYENGCCTTQNGCSRALAAGIADYHVALIFPDSTALGETWLNQTAGLSSCTQTRAVDRSESLTRAQAYSVCNGEDRDGDIYALGSLYASVWWQVRKSLSEGDKIQLDQLFSKHLTLLDGQDDFDSAMVKIQTADTELFGGKFAERLKAEYDRR